MVEVFVVTFKKKPSGPNVRVFRAESPASSGPSSRPTLKKSTAPQSLPKPRGLEDGLGTQAQTQRPFDQSADGRVRLAKVLSERGLCSRRDADEFIRRGLVRVDGEIVNLLGFKVSREARVELLPEAIRSLRSRVTILLHKPVGYVSGQPEPGYVPAVRLIQRQTQMLSASDDVLVDDHLKGLAPAGRLDIDSTGLLVLTQDGVLAKSLIGEDSTIEKEYIVRVEGQMREGGLELLRHGLVLDGEPLKEAKVEWLNPDQLRFVLREGKKRQIRRMCDEVGLRVLALKRVRIGNVRLGSLPEGRWRFLRPGENF